MSRQDIEAEILRRMDSKAAEDMAFYALKAWTALAKNDYAGFAAAANQWTAAAATHSGKPASPFRELVNMARAHVEIHTRKMGDKAND